MYALPDITKSSSTPAMLEKSSELIEYLDAKVSEEPILQNIPEYSKINGGSSMGPVPLSNPAALGILSGMSMNPLYHKTDIIRLHKMPQNSAASENGMPESKSIYLCRAPLSKCT